jgi:hypothetical protein
LGPDLAHFSAIETLNARAPDNYFEVVAQVRNENEFPLWYSGQSSWLQIQRSRIRFPALPNVLRNSGPGTGSTQLREGK